MPDDGPAPSTERKDDGSIAELKESLLAGISELAGGSAEEQVHMLLDYVQTTMTADHLDDAAAFKDRVVERSVPFIQQSRDIGERHLRLMGVSHVLVNLIRPSVEATGDEYTTSRFEELRDRLTCLERVDEANPSLDNRLRYIYEGLVELATTMGVTTCEPLTF